MTGPLATFVRRSLPALAVGAVLGLSFLLPAPSLGASSDVGYGYANNCGIKGDGSHDHGKTCPNRPFPGKGKGLAIAVTKGETGTGDTNTAPASVSFDNGATTNTNVTVGTSGSGENTQTAAAITHGKSGVHGHGRAIAETTTS